MGNRAVHFQQLSEETSPPLKVGFSDSYSMSVEMEPLQGMNEDNKWDKTYPQCGIRAKRLSCGRFKPRINMIFCCLIASIVAVLFLFLVYKCTYTKVTPIDSSSQGIENDVSSINNTQDHISEKILSLKHNISQLGSQLNAIRSSIQQASSTSQVDSSLSKRLSQLENQLNKLSSQIHNPVNLYENCQEETASCSIDPDGSHTDYWRDCPTKYLPLHKQGWFTISYQCKYKSTSRMNMEALTPFEWNGKIRCDCDVTFPGDDTERHRPVPRDISATCTLVVVRCPLSQTVYQ